MFWTIVGAILFIEIGLPLIMGLVALVLEDKTVGCIIFGLVILAVILILG